MRAMGIILAGGGMKNSRMGELAAKRAVAAMPVAGSYRSIDFALSNMSNSHIQKVAVLTQDNARSLNEHLSSSKWWDFGRKQGGMYVFTPTRTLDNTDWYRGTADSIAQNIEFIKDSHEPYVVIASGDCVYKMDYGKVLEYHIDKKADITVVCKEMPENVNVDRFGCVQTDADGRITDFEEKPVQAKSNTISCGIYIIRRRQLVEMIEKAALENRYDFVKDVLIRYKDIKRIYAYKMDDYWKNISTIQDYYDTNMDFLNPEIRKYFFKTFPDIYSKVDDLPPAKYNVGVEVRNSLVASGSIINGVVENSVIFKKAFIGSNCTIKNSIILNDVYIGDNSYIENCIVESRSTIRANSVQKGEEGIKIVVEKNERYVI
ncbi:MAG: glucose-1-phosphate adenylyltransferase subunit GlgD [Prevotella sp.]|jgi:glucose-1-phosphate adenylyltransferase|nr:glucose-1-phosphate adenylyltransferase subunit GlgD [Prevotella sp.]MCR5011720.1 glucose-1-phosphate adenylyltransferase subunit GlgD [Lachnospiraceae bacterium]